MTLKSDMCLILWFIIDVELCWFIFANLQKLSESLIYLPES